MPEPITVWAVELGRSPNDRKGTLTLREDGLHFEPGDGSREISIALAELRKVRRLRGSPVLMVAHLEEGRIRRTAFYFVQPPPLEPSRDQPPERVPNLFSSMGKHSRRRIRRDNAGYLGLWNREKKRAVAEWADAVRAAAETA
ncbi:MAG TPA: hypothetical protein VE646_09855 [Actinomycetota bacterium]|jgi:hypothetical protein|nr:hypothetical protein [Actinomycetota bacterium]